MSRANIIDIEPIGEPIPTGVNVTFSVHGAEGSREYNYAGTDAALAIMGGADPADFEGVEGGAPSDSGIGEAIEGAVDIGEVGEIGEIGLLL